MMRPFPLFLIAASLVALPETATAAERQPLPSAPAEAKAVMLTKLAPAADEDMFDIDPIVASDGRIKMLSYNENDIYTLMTRVGYQSNIEFEPGEEIATISVGERSFWQIIPNGSRLFVRPLQEGVSTNMTVITNFRSYQFDLKSAEDEDTRIVYVVKFLYPEEMIETHSFVGNPALGNMPPAVDAAPVYPVSDPQIVPVPAQPLTSPMDTRPVYNPAFDSPVVDSFVPPMKRNYLYTFSGPEYASPYEVFDDGNTTYFRYQPPRIEAPKVAVENYQGKEVALTPYRAGEYYAVDMIAPQIVLYSPQGTVFLFNEMLTPTSGL